ncbi:MAG: DUF4062 domain-containing protein [Blautia sp.]|nr:DUF4062 domain-containing protein [Blautia sp.]
MLKKVQRRDKHMKPRIFVSSTFYDLKYMRDDLSNYIKAHDFEPIMFEDGDIGYTPGKHLDESCYETMKSADMVILIIGGNYGSPASGENKDDFKEYLSVTRKEFKTAVDEAIPVFVFIDASVYAEYGIYEENTNEIESGDCIIKFRATKDINVFRFIRDIKAVGDISITEFKKSGEIKNFLGKQWSDMFKLYLKSLRKNASTLRVHDSIERLNTMVKQMEVMVNGLGKNVLKDESAEFDRILMQQRQIKAQEIARRISNYLTCNFSTKNRKHNVTVLVESYRDLLKNMKEEKLDLSVPDDLKIFKKFISNLSDNGIGVSCIVNSLMELDELLKEFCKSDEIRDEVINNLMKSQYYDNLSKRENEVTVNEIETPKEM